MPCEESHPCMASLFAHAHRQAATLSAPSQLTSWQLVATGHAKTALFSARGFPDPDRLIETAGQQGALAIEGERRNPVAVANQSQHFAAGLQVPKYDVVISSGGFQAFFPRGESQAKDTCVVANHAMEHDAVGPIPHKYLPIAKAVDDRR